MKDMILSFVLNHAFYIFILYELYIEFLFMFVFHS